MSSRDHHRRGYQQDGPNARMMLQLSQGDLKRQPGTEPPSRDAEEFRQHLRTHRANTSFRNRTEDQSRLKLFGGSRLVVEIDEYISVD